MQGWPDIQRWGLLLGPHTLKMGHMVRGGVGPPSGLDPASRAGKGANTQLGAGAETAQEGCSVQGHWGCYLEIKGLEGSSHHSQKAVLGGLAGR